MLIPNDFLNSKKSHLQHLFTSKLQLLHAVKVQLTLVVKYIKPLVDHPGIDTPDDTTMYHKTKITGITQSMDLEDKIDQLGSEFQIKMSEYQENYSEWSLKQIVAIEVKVIKYESLSGSRYIATPPKLLSRKACVKVRNHGPL